MHPHRFAALHQDSLHGGGGAQAAAVAFHAPHQGRRHRRAAADRVVEAGVGFEPLAKQGDHGRGAGVVQLQAGDQEAEQLHPVQQEGIAQMTAGDRPETAPQGRQLRRFCQQSEAVATEGEGAAEAGAQGQQRQGADGAAERFDRQQKALPLFRYGGPAQLAQHLQEGLHAHPHPQATLRQQQVPVLIRHHRQGFTHRLEHLGERVGGGPAAQAAPQGGPRFELEAAPTEAMGRATGNAMGLQHQHIKAVAGGDGAGAEAPQASADHDQVGLAGVVAGAVAGRAVAAVSGVVVGRFSHGWGRRIQGLEAAAAARGCWRRAQS